MINTHIRINIEKQTQDRTEVLKPQKLHLCWGKQDNGVTNCCVCQVTTESLGVRLSQQEPPPNHLRGPPESRTRKFHTKYRAFQCLPSLMWTGGVLQSIPGALIMRIPCSTIHPLDLSTSKHKLTLMFRIACSTPGTMSSVISIIRSPAAGIKPLLVSISTTQNSGRNIPTNNLTNSSIEHN